MGFFLSLGVFLMAEPFKQKPKSEVRRVCVIQWAKSDPRSAARHCKNQNGIPPSSTNKITLGNIPSLCQPYLV